jgi:hypothetical protein
MFSFQIDNTYEKSSSYAQRIVPTLRTPEGVVVIKAACRSSR